jgi:hypothetical protein
MCWRSPPAAPRQSSRSRFGPDVSHRKLSNRRARDVQHRSRLLGLLLDLVSNGLEPLTRTGVEVLDQPLGCDVEAPRLEARSAA